MRRCFGLQSQLRVRGEGDSLPSHRLSPPPRYLTAGAQPGLLAKCRTYRQKQAGLLLSIVKIVAQGKNDQLQAGGNPRRENYRHARGGGFKSRGGCQTGNRASDATPHSRCAVRSGHQIGGRHDRRIQLRGISLLNPDEFRSSSMNRFDATCTRIALASQRLSGCRNQFVFVPDPGHVIRDYAG
jgi:hypothetical protein